MTIVKCPDNGAPLHISIHCHPFKYENSSVMHSECVNGEWKFHVCYGDTHLLITRSSESWSFVTENFTGPKNKEFEFTLHRGPTLYYLLLEFSRKTSIVNAGFYLNNKWGLVEVKNVIPSLGETEAKIEGVIRHRISCDEHRLIPVSGIYDFVNEVGVFYAEQPVYKVW